MIKTDRAFASLALAMRPGTTQSVFTMRMSPIRSYPYYRINPQLNKNHYYQYIRSLIKINKDKRVTNHKSQLGYMTECIKTKKGATSRRPRQLKTKGRWEVFCFPLIELCKLIIPIRHFCLHVGECCRLIILLHCKDSS